ARQIPRNPYLGMAYVRCWGGRRLSGRFQKGRPVANMAPKRLGQVLQLRPCRVPLLPRPSGFRGEVRLADSRGGDSGSYGLRVPEGRSRGDPKESGLTVRRCYSLLAAGIVSFLILFHVFRFLLA